MASRIKPLPPLEAEQAKAADPAVHASLSASAGTGKTQVLTARVLRLLLSGVLPEHILCLTFTKAGAAEMANRINARLAAWVRMKDAELAADLLALGEEPGLRMRERARRLFARILDAPGGLRIQTIHSFAQALLAAFPAEAGIAPGFTALEGRAEQELARSTLATMLVDAEAQGDNMLVSDVQCLSLRLGEQDAVAYLMLCTRAGEAMLSLGPAQTIESKLRVAMALPEGSVDDYLAARCADDSFDCDLLQAIAAANRRWGTATGSGAVDRINQWLQLDNAARAATLSDLALAVFTGTGDLKKVHAGQIKADPDYQAHADRLAEKISELMAIQNANRLACDMAAGLRAGQAFAAAYTRAKRSAGVADFDDLIRWTRKLLAQPGMGEWVRYKLDQRTDHILVDESQDTNRDQWEIVQALAEEFFTGSSEAERRHRTIFMVGDFKQAIFRFQGTDPREFERARRWVQDNSSALREAEGASDDAELRALEFRDLSIDASFRSAPAILEAVDAVIDEVGYREMGLERPPNPHRAHFAALPGLVEIWKPFTGDESDGGDEGEEGWLDERARLYADALAKQVREWLDQAATLASTKRPMTAGDVLILVRSRGELASLIVARLFMAGVPVAGIDRLHLSKPFAVRDLLAAATFATQPLDDLNLANLLVSPLIGWDQQQLFDLAYGRAKMPLWRALRECAPEREDFRAAYEQLGSLLAMADYAVPSRFLETILSGPLDGRRKLYRRLGLSARDPIDELMASALEFERAEPPSLERFLAWFNRGDVEIQRDASAPINAVRVMTVHGSKGLEAPVVIVADATADPAKLGGVARSLSLNLDGQRVPVIRPRKAERVPPFDQILDSEQKADLEEHWRLLYVALTRAKERLVVAGLEPQNGRLPEDCWYMRVERALVGLGADAAGDGRWGQVRRYRGSVRPAALRPKPPRTTIPPLAMPDWAVRPAPQETRPSQPLAPSAQPEDREAANPPSPEMRAAARRGTLIHQLLERLPPLAPHQRQAAALRWLERNGALEALAEREDIASQLCAILADPAFARFFGEGSLPEAPIVATLPDGRVIAGVVDRLLVEAGQVLVLDFKTGRVPRSPDDIPPAHRSQMASYVEALQTIFSGREVGAALLYTSGPRLFELGA